MPSTDRAFLTAAFVFGDGIEPDLSVFTEVNRTRYHSMILGRGNNLDREMELSRLRETFEAQKKVDLTRVHPSWVVRALQPEPRSVQLAVLAQLPEKFQEEAVAELAISREEISAAQAPESEYRSIAVAQSLSKLVGDLAVVENDPPVIHALTMLEPSAAPRMIRRIGILKWSLTSIPLPPNEQIEFDRWRSWVEAMGSCDPHFSRSCQSELERIKPLDARALNRLGLGTFSRLLTPVDPHRARWTLQQLPYSTAKTLRSRMGDSVSDFAVLLSEETRLFKATWVALWEEGAIKRPWPTETSG